MRVLRTLPPATNSQSAGIQINLGPFQPERLPLPQAQGQSDSPAGTVTTLPRRLKQALHLLDRVRLDFRLIAEAWRLRERRHVSGQVAPAYRFTQRCSHRSVRLVSSRWLTAQWNQDAFVLFAAGGVGLGASEAWFEPGDLLAGAGLFGPGAA